jgi:DNA-binding transcriptional regulator YiaG
VTPEDLRRIQHELAEQLGRKLSDREFGEIVGVLDRSVRRWKDGEREIPITVEKLLAIAIRDGVESIPSEEEARRILGARNRAPNAGA